MGGRPCASRSCAVGDRQDDEEVPEEGTGGIMGKGANETKHMKLMTKELEKRFAEVGTQEDAKDPMVIAKYFDPCGAYTFLAISHEPEERLLFGYASLWNDHNNEFGYTSLDELESIRGALGLGIERDLYLGELPLSIVKNKYGIV